MKLSRTIIVGLVLLLLLSVAAPMFAGGNKEIPEVPPLTSGTQYISPDSNGVQDNAELSFSVKVYVKSDEGYVPEYGIQILDQSGTVMKEVVETEKSDIGWFLSIFRGYSEFTLERTITWDGTDKTGKTVPDGIYNVKLWVVDSSKNRNEIDVDNFVVDTQKPEAILVAPESLIFSPNGDNSMDSIEIGNTRSTEEALWSGSIEDENGNVIRTFSWENGLPGTAVWDGLDDDGVPASPGSYSFSLSSTDEAGNVSDPIVLEGIILDLTATPIAVLIDIPVISPDGNGVQDSMTVYLDLAVTEGIVFWEWQIRDSRENVYWQVTGDTDIPEEVIFDGMDSDGNPVPEGDYSFIYKVSYENGNKPSVLEHFKVDVTAPVIKVSVANNIFSPNGDGLKDQVEIWFKSNEQVNWKGSVIDVNGEELISTGSSITTSLIVWDGKNNNGEDVPDGNYSVIASFTDLAGNTSFIDPPSLIVDREPVDVALKTGKGFSPDSDGVSDDLIILVDASQYDYLESWKLDILDTEGNVVRDIKGEDILPPEIYWDGTSVNADGDISTAQEGEYRVRLSANFQKGDRVETVSDSFVLDITPPQILIDVAADPFAATDDGIEGEVYVTLKVLDNTEINHWSMDVLNGEGDLLRTYSGSGDPSGNIRWNSAESSEGSSVSIDNPDFVLRLTVYDSGNNESVFQKEIPLDILLVMKDGKKYLSVPNIIFGAYKYALDSAGPERFTENNRSLDKVASIYRKYPAYGLVLEGHALNIYLDTPREGDEEKILLPLTSNRASSVREALVDRGMSGSKISIEAYGGQFPIASVTDKTVWWKNRRVEFVMTDPEE